MAMQLFRIFEFYILDHLKNKSLFEGNLDSAGQPIHQAQIRVLNSFNGSK